MNIEQIAKTCHQVNKAYCESIGDHSQYDWEEAPDWQKKSPIDGVLYYLAHPDSTPSDSHDSWLKEKKADGWVHGLIIDAKLKTHPSLMPFDQLPKEQQTKDVLFITVVRSLVDCQ